VEGTSPAAVLEELLVLAPIALRAPARAITYIVLSTHLARNLLWILDRWNHRFNESSHTILGKHRPCVTGGREGGRGPGKTACLFNQQRNKHNLCYWHHLLL
jgi:hypothetical protein